MRMELDIANRRLETVDEEKRKLVQERDEVGMADSWLYVYLLLDDGLLYGVDRMALMHVSHVIQERYTVEHVFFAAS